MKIPTQPINASNNFTLRNRCKHCGCDKFVFYHDMTNPYFTHDVRLARNRSQGDQIKNWVLWTHYDYQRVLDAQKKNARISYSHSIAFKGYAPKYYSGCVHGWVPNEVIMVTCSKCQQQAWAYVKSYSLEGISRRARIYPTRVKATYWIKLI